MKKLIKLIREYRRRKLRKWCVELVAKHGSGYCDMKWLDYVRFTADWLMLFIEEGKYVDAKGKTSSPDLKV